MPSAHDRLPQLEVKSRAAWRAWLQEHHADAKGVWLVTWPRGKGGLTYDDAIEEALCFGWVDARMRRHEDAAFAHVFGPRKPQSAWSAANRERVEALERRGLMRAAGRRAVAIGKANGAWRTVEATAAGAVPEALAAALARSPIAKRRFDAMTPATRATILRWIKGGTTPDARTERIRITVQLAQRGLKSSSARDRARLGARDPKAHGASGV